MCEPQCPFREFKEARIITELEKNIKHMGSGLDFGPFIDVHKKENIKG